MSDDKTNRGAQDRSRININEPYEVTYWMQKFDVPREHLVAAVKKVGVSSAAVAKELGRAL
jgi:hypothetical protein